MEQFVSKLPVGGVLNDSCPIHIFLPTPKFEGAVREASHCAASERGERGRSIMCHMRSSTHILLNKKLADIECNRIKCANGHLGAGKPGERIVQSERSKQIHSSDTDKDGSSRVRCPQGAIRATAVILDTVERRKVQQTVNQGNGRKREDLVERRNEQQLEKNEKAKYKNKEPTATETRKAYHITDRVLGLTIINALLTDWHFEDVITELQFRLVTVESNVQTFSAHHVKLLQTDEQKR
jgi:hypothetical protein